MLCVASLCENTASKTLIHEENPDRSGGYFVQKQTRELISEFGNYFVRLGLHIYRMHHYARGIVHVGAEVYQYNLEIKCMQSFSSPSDFSSLIVYSSQKRDKIQ